MTEWSKTIEVRWADADANHHMRHSAYADRATLITQLVRTDDFVTLPVDEPQSSAP